MTFFLAWAGIGWVVAFAIGASINGGIGISRSRGKGGKRAHCVNSGVRSAQRAAIKRRNRARNKAHH